MFDGVGDTRALLDSSGAVLNRTAYSAWGTALTGFAPNTPFGWKGQRGQYTDSETSFVYCRARYYSPALGRFLSRDPSGFSAGPNLYSYCAGDPVNFFDASGFGPESNEAARDEGLGWDAVRLGSNIEGFTHTPMFWTPIINAHDSFSNWGSLEGNTKADPNDLFWARVNAGVSFAGAAASIAGPVLAGVNALGAVTAEAGAVGTTVGEAGGITRVGRWMSQAEYDAMVAKGSVPESLSGTTHVATPADPTAYLRQAKPGTYYVEFDVPSSSVKPTQTGWGKILGPNSLEGRLAARKGLPIPQMPPVQNIEHMGTKLP